MKIESFSLSVDALNADAKVHVMLPVSYEKSNKLYPVFYMNDGQGVFFDDEREHVEGMRFAAYAEKMVDFLPEILIVAVEAPPTRFERMSWYMPAWNYSKTLNVTYGADFAAHGKEYANWLAKSLKPYIDTRYRTDASREATAMGGLSASCEVASYTVGKYPDLYSKLTMLSPSHFLWWPALEPIYEDLDFRNLDAVFSYVGTNETGKITKRTDFIESSKLIEEIMKKRGLSQDALLHITQPGGEHTMVGWRFFFAEAIRWMYRTKPKG